MHPLTVYRSVLTFRLMLPDNSSLSSCQTLRVNAYELIVCVLCVVSVVQKLDHVVIKRKDFIWHVLNLKTLIKLLALNPVETLFLESSNHQHETLIPNKRRAMIWLALAHTLGLVVPVCGLG